MSEDNRPTWNGTDFFGEKIVAIRGNDGSIILSTTTGPKMKTFSLSAESCRDIQRWLKEQETHPGKDATRT
jgi:hypothetical protein